MFFKGSRYAAVPEHETTDAEGRVIRYKKVRFIPSARPQFGHIISQGERLDHIAYHYYRDPERFWLICDINLAMWPADLVSEIGRKINIPPAAG